MPNPGELLLDRYRILERLGSGGMATVHRAHDERLDRDVAVKVLLPNFAHDPATATRFEREARSLAASSHPGVVAVFDVDAGDPATGREPFFVMELCRGGSLADRLGLGRAMAPGDLVPILVSVADGLADLHRRGIVHRDIKPQNILFADDRAKLADFGLARSDDGQGVSELTTPGTTVGTLAYLAPEILAGERAAAAADVYALGVVAFVGLTGRPPRPATSMAELVTAARSAAPSISAVAPGLGPAFDDVVGAALGIRPEDRPDALAFASGLTSALGRWTRDGGPGRWGVGPSAAGAAVTDPSLLAVARPAPGDGVLDEDVTTAMAIPLGLTAAIPATPNASPRSGPPPTPTENRTGATGRATSWLGRATVAVALLLVAMVVLAKMIGSSSPSAAGPSAAPSRGPAASASAPAASSSRSIAPSPSVAAPSPSPDPALASLQAMNAAIGAARGGPDGLKGKEANDLEQRTADIGRALATGDRAAALELARKLDKRIRDLGKDAVSLRDESAALIRALGG